MKDLRRFEVISDYLSYQKSDDWIIPNICLITESDEIKFNPLKEDYCVTGKVLRINDFSVTVTSNNQLTLNRGFVDNNILTL